MRYTTPLATVRKDEKNVVEFDVHKSILRIVKNELPDLDGMVEEMSIVSDRVEDNVISALGDHISLEIFPRSRKGSEYALVRLYVDVESAKRAVLLMDNDLLSVHSEQFKWGDKAYVSTENFRSNVLSFLDEDLEEFITVSFKEIKRLAKTKISGKRGFYNVADDMSIGYRLAKLERESGTLDFFKSYKSRAEEAIDTLNKSGVFPHHIEATRPQNLKKTSKQVKATFGGFIGSPDAVDEFGKDCHYEIVFLSNDQYRSPFEHKLDDLYTQGSFTLYIDRKAVATAKAGVMDIAFFNKVKRVFKNKFRVARLERIAYTPKHPSSDPRNADLISYILNNDIISFTPRGNLSGRAGVYYYPIGFGSRNPPVSLYLSGRKIAIMEWNGRKWDTYLDENLKDIRLNPNLLDRWFRVMSRKVERAKASR